LDATTYEKELFSDRLALICPQLLNKFSVVLNVFCIFSCKRFSDIAKKYVWALNAPTGKLNFIKD